jgi:glycosidase
VCWLLVSTLAACGSSATPTRRPLPTLTPTIALPTSTPLPTDTPIWLRDAVFYRIFVRSFYDSNGDGIGDLAGITQKLDYAQGLGVNTLALTSVFSATSYHGYDITDYLTIAPELGTQDDLANLIREAHSRGLRVTLDLVAGYTSSQHPFFQDAFRNKDSSYGEWYMWTNASRTAYKAWGNAKELPLLNLDSAIVQRYMVEVALDWMDLNDDGSFEDSPDGFICPDAEAAPHAFWKMLRTEAKAVNPNFALVGEVWQKEPAQLVPYYEQEFDALFDFPLYHTLLGSEDRNGDGALNGLGKPQVVADALNKYKVLPAAAQVVRFINTFDTNRVASEVKNDPERQRQAMVLLLTLPGTPMLYYGEEIGMQGSRGAAPHYDQYRREPMDWYAAEDGPGMTTWFKPKNRNNRADDGISVEEEAGQKDAPLVLYKKLIETRRTHPALDMGGFQVAKVEQCPACLAYWRWNQEDIYLVLLNLSNETQSGTIDFTLVPRPVRGAGDDVLRSGIVNVPSNGRYTLTVEAAMVRVLHWGRP